MVKNILITGAAGNLGSACVAKIILEGHKAIATVSPGKTLPAQAHLFIYEVDLTLEDIVKNVIGKIISDNQKIDAAILTVGGFAMGSIENTSTQDIQKMLKLNFETAYNVVRPLLSHFRERNGGHFVFIGSKPALEPMTGKGSVAYSLSKTLIFKLAELINADGTGNIKATVIVPNIIDTPENRKGMPNADFSRWLTPQSIANTTYDVICGKRNEDVIKLY